jgi:hypothetical protein
MEDKTKMVWKSPPNSVRYKREKIDWSGIAEALRSNPGEWALAAEDVNPSTVTHVRYGRLQAFVPEGEFEASGQGRNESGYTKELYVRFVGDAKAREALKAKEAAKAAPATKKNESVTKIETLEISESELADFL